MRPTAPVFRPTAIAVALVSLATVAQAQQAPAGDAAAADAQDKQVVTVTATRRLERLQDVPLAVSTASGEQLQQSGVVSVTDIGKAVSGVTYGLSPQDAGFRVRGVGSMGGFTSASESPVGVVLDGVVMGLGPLIESMVDVERVEALKGPQGTQFGKNASSGVVSLVTRKPRLGRSEGEFSLSLGSLAERQLQGVINIPLGETAAARVAVFNRKHGGFIQNNTLNEEWGGVSVMGARVKLMAKPTRDLELLLTLDSTKVEQQGPGQMWTLRSPPPVGFTVPAGVTPSATNTVTGENARSFENQGSGGVAMEVNYQAGQHTLTSVTAFRERDIQCRFGLDLTASPRFEGACEKDYTQRSQEFRLTSPRGQLEYVAGVFWSKVTADTRDSAWLNVAPGVFANLTNGVNRTQTTTDSAALFADGKLRLGSSFSVLAGARVTRDEVSAVNATDTSGPLAILGRPAGFLTPGTARNVSGETSATKPAGRLGLEWKAAADTLLYATVARGYLGPTVTYSGTSGTRTDVAAQTVNDVTVGFKSQMFGRRLTVNGSVFSDTYKNLQVGVFNGVEFLTQNAGGMRSRGAELDLSARLGGGLSARASVTYADAVFTDFVTTCPNTGDPARCYTVGTSTTRLYQAAGQPLTGAPKLTSALGLDWGTSITSGLQLDASLSASHRSKTSYGVGETSYVQDGFTLVNAGIKLTPDSERWQLGLYARNLFDKHFQAAVIGVPFAAPGGTLNWNSREARRTLGVTLGTKF